MKWRQAAAAAAQSSTGSVGYGSCRTGPGWMAIRCGCVYIGIAFEGSVYAARFQFTGSREEIRRQAACEALALALGVVSE
ncbi:MAG: CinA family protein [Lachnospira sp.]